MGVTMIEVSMAFCMVGLIIVCTGLVFYFGCAIIMMRYEAQLIKSGVNIANAETLKLEINTLVTTMKRLVLKQRQLSDRYQQLIDDAGGESDIRI